MHGRHVVAIGLSILAVPLATFRSAAVKPAAVAPVEKFRANVFGLLRHMPPKIAPTADGGVVHQCPQGFRLLPPASLAFDFAFRRNGGDDTLHSFFVAHCYGVVEQSFGDAGIDGVESGFRRGAEQVCPLELVADVDAAAACAGQGAPLFVVEFGNAGRAVRQAFEQAVGDEFADRFGAIEGLARTAGLVQRKQGFEEMHERILRVAKLGLAEITVRACPEAAVRIGIAQADLAPCLQGRVEIAFVLRCPVGMREGKNREGLAVEPLVVILRFAIGSDGFIPAAMQRVAEVLEQEVRAEPDLFEVGGLAGQFMADGHEVDAAGVADDVAGLGIEHLPVARHGGVEKAVGGRQHLEPVFEMVLFEGLAMPVAIDARADVVVVAAGG